MSLWSWVNQPEELKNFKNPLFEANSLVIWPSVAPQSLQLWEAQYLCSDAALSMLPQKTMSLWSWVNQPEELKNFKNPLFEANSLVIWPSVAPQSLQLWE
ncbi:hypothetical protein CIB84_014645, partial [Bambusicola thoracicus]